MNLVAQALSPSHGFAWTLENILIAVVIVAAMVALVWIALREFKITIPPWVLQILWVVAVAFVVIMAIKFLTPTMTTRRL